MTFDIVVILTLMTLVGDIDVLTTTVEFIFIVKYTKYIVNGRLILLALVT